MPFILPASEQRIALDWDRLTINEFTAMRDSFENRHDFLKKTNPQYDYSDELDPIRINASPFLRLVQNASIDDYLVAHFSCDDYRNNFRNMTLLFSIRDSNAVYGAKNDEIINAKGTFKKNVDITNAIANHALRRSDIRRFAHLNIFDNDPMGRAHKISQTMKNEVASMCSGKYIWAYFILDSTGPGGSCLSVAFSADSTLTKPFTFEAYDHGSACCPI